MQIGIHSSDCQMKIIFVKVCSHRYSTFRLQYDNAGKCNSMPSYLIYIYIYIYVYYGGNDSWRYWYLVYLTKNLWPYHFYQLLSACIIVLSQVEKTWRWEPMLLVLGTRRDLKGLPFEKWPPLYIADLPKTLIFHSRLCMSFAWKVIHFGEISQKHERLWVWGSTGVNLPDLPHI